MNASREELLLQDKEVLVDQLIRAWAKIDAMRIAHAAALIKQVADGDELRGRFMKSGKFIAS